jgi:hypothetical protein
LIARQRNIGINSSVFRVINWCNVVRHRHFGAPHRYNSQGPRRPSSWVAWLSQFGQLGSPETPV